MGEVILVRHGQARFGSADYDRLSPLGHTQAAALGAALAGLGTAPDGWFTGSLRRQRETFQSLSQPFAPARATIHEGLDEFDGGALLRAHRAASPDAFRALLGDRNAFFRALREGLVAWQRGEIQNPPEPFEAFRARVEAARAALFRPRGTVVAVSSGGPIALMVADTLRAPMEAMADLQLQLKNASVTRIRFGARGASLAAFNETPHVTGTATLHLATHS